MQYLGQKINSNVSLISFINSLKFKHHSIIKVRKFSLDSFFTKIIENYDSFQLNTKNENGIFFKNWSNLHRNLFLQMSKENFEILTREFMAKRARFASSFIQYLKTSENSIEKIKNFKELLKYHDERFSKLLKEVLNYYSDELIKVQRHRKVTAAYLNSQA